MDKCRHSYSCDKRVGRLGPWGAGFYFFTTRLRRIYASAFSKDTLSVRDDILMWLFNRPLSLIRLKTTGNWPLEVLGDHRVQGNMLPFPANIHIHLAISHCFYSNSLEVRLAVLETKIDIIGCFSDDSSVNSKNSLSSRMICRSHDFI